MDAYKNLRTIDRAKIMQEIEQNKMAELRQNLNNTKGFTRKMKYTSNDVHQKKFKVNTSLINPSQNQQIQNRISQLGGMGGIESIRRGRHHLALATTASQTTLNNQIEQSYLQKENQIT
jgi:hypothetical protein